MGTAERRLEIMKLLCRRRHTTIRILSSELGVSTRTIQRDIEILSRTEPIYTQVGKYNGGIYIMDGYSMDRMYMTDTEIKVLQKLYLAAKESSFLLTNDEKQLLHHLILQYTKPNIKKERNLS